MLTDLHCTRAEASNPDVADVLSSSSHQLQTDWKKGTACVVGQSFWKADSWWDNALEGLP